MNKYIDRIFKNGKADINRLKESGFTERNKKFYKSFKLECGLTVEAEIGESVRADVFDEFKEPYTLFLDEEASGSFVGGVRSEYEKTLLGIAEKCFDFSAFKNSQTQQITDYVLKKYGDALEFPWGESDGAIWRKKDNKKWYGVIMTVKRSKLGFDTDEKAEIINLHALPAEVEKLVDNKTVFGGYHMNKKHWITIFLDGSVSLERIYALIDRSYDIS